jgi:hypothetical protein
LSKVLPLASRGGMVVARPGAAKSRLRPRLAALQAQTVARRFPVAKCGATGSSREATEGSHADEGVRPTGVLHRLCHSNERQEMVYPRAEVHRLMRRRGRPRKTIVCPTGEGHRLKPVLLNARIFAARDDSCSRRSGLLRSRADHKNRWSTPQRAAGLRRQRRLEVRATRRTGASGGTSLRRGFAR